MLDQTFVANGKLLLTSEYFVLNGAKALALPVQYGQALNVHTLDTQVHPSPTLHWVGRDHDQSIWIDVLFDIHTLEIIVSKTNNHQTLQKILQETRHLNPSFLNNMNKDVLAESNLTFPRQWGLGSSSTLISLLSDWASICPYTLLNKTLGGSGYDIACAKANTPILYSNKISPLLSKSVTFAPAFTKNIYFVYLNKKENTHHNVAAYNQMPPPNQNDIRSIENIVDQIIAPQCTLNKFEQAMTTHETILGQHLNRTPVKEDLFPDYWGAIKSLGAWGGDFILCTSDLTKEETFAYFEKRGYNTILKYKDMVLNEK